MGVVWKATDTTLGREVAIKILPPDFASDEDRLARFDREARLLASLNHPNIAGIHKDKGTHFLAMPDQPRANSSLSITCDQCIELIHHDHRISRDQSDPSVRATRWLAQLLLSRSRVNLERSNKGTLRAR